MAGNPATISPTTALLCAVLFTALYVAPFYLSPTLRSHPLQPRDAPTVIQARVRAVGLTCLLCAVITVYILTFLGHAGPHAVLRLLGIWPVGLIDTAKVLLLVCVLFVGPLYETIVVNQEWRDASLSQLQHDILYDWIWYRNLVIAPASEEVVFRSFTIALYLLAHVHPTRIVFTTPLIFGLAHVHHLVEFLQSRTRPGHRIPSTPVIISGILRSLFQFTYTSLFGCFAAFVFLRTGNLWAVILAHSFCNYMGVPRVWGRVGQFAFPHESHHITPDVAQGKPDQGQAGEGADKHNQQSPQYGPQNWGVQWTVLYYALILLGTLGFYRLLWPLTESRNALTVF